MSGSCLKLRAQSSAVFPGAETHRSKVTHLYVPILRKLMGLRVGLREESLRWEQSKWFTSVISLGSSMPLQDSAVEILSATLLIPQALPIWCGNRPCVLMDTSRQGSLEPPWGLAPTEKVICCFQAWPSKISHVTFNLCLLSACLNGMTPKGNFGL